MSEVQVVAFLSSHVDLSRPANTEAPLPSEIVWMPAGSHEINAGTLDSGDGFSGTVTCNEAGARRVVSSFERMRASQPRCYLDFNHDEEEAAADVCGFSWDPMRGIVAQVRWTGAGERALRSRGYISFSPAFLLDQETSEVLGLIPGHALGGLVNNPAFGTAMPLLIAARLGGKHTSPAPSGTPANHQTNMENANANGAAAVAAAAPSRNENAAANSNDELRTVIAAQTKQLADLAAVIQQVQANQQQSAAAIVRPGVAEAAPVQASATPNAMEALKLMAGLKPSESRKRGQLYRDARALIAKEANVAQVLAANSLGSLFGDLVSMRSLELLKISFPQLFKLSTDFSAENAYYGQQIKTRLVSVPTVQEYSTSTGYASTAATTADVGVTINKHKYVQIEFNANECASTGRDLFGEQVGATHYALGKDLFDAIYALITATNFTNATTKATNAVARSTLLSMDTALTSRGVPTVGRIGLWSPGVWEVLANDSTIVQLAAYQRPEVIEGITLPPVAGFENFRAVNLPNTANLTGFGCTGAALAIAIRTVADYSKASAAGSGGGAVSIVENIDTGLAVTKTDYVDHNLGKAISRIAWMYGVAVGDAAQGQRLVSA